MAQPPKRPTSESTRHLRAVGAHLRDLTPEDVDLRTKQILVWGTAADCMNALVDESEKLREAADADRAESAAKRTELALARDALGDVKRVILYATVASLLLHAVISWAYSRNLVAPDPLQAKRDKTGQEP